MNWSSVYQRLPLARELRHVNGLASNLAVDRVLAQHQHREELLARSRYAEPGRLNRFEHQAFSQNGEDGILDEIFNRIGVTDRRFVEMAAGYGLENNTAYRLATGWRGAWFDGDPGNVERIRSVFHAELADGRVSIAGDFVTTDNVNALLARAGFAGAYDLLSLDVDMNTFWLWQAMADARPRVVCVEYNSAFPAGVDWSVAYRPDSRWNNDGYMGCSLKALELLGRKKGYALVGCDLTGTNAFFVDSTLVGDRFAAPFTSENHYEPCRYYLLSRAFHPRGWGPGGPTAT